ncbi:Diphthine methyltransferase protein [Rutstroemia sp. NJR-2017a BBW]|nr:Diphthine methyltransferase protein [Rutstroemia sp. NJR-2017a BBW]
MLDNGDPSPDIVHVKTWKVFDDSVLITYFAWCPLPQEEGTKSLVVAASTGVVQLITITGGLKPDSSIDDLSLRKEDPALSLHSLKVPYVGEEPQYAYCCVWASAPGGLSNDFSAVFSGGDDSKLRTSILGTSMEANDDFSYNLPTSFSGHDAAVIAILPLPCADKKWILLTGSYDNKQYSMWEVEHIALSFFMTILVLATCMEAGVKILDIQRKEDVWSMNVIAHADIEAPKSSTPSNTAQLCYASAVQQNIGNDDVIFVSSCFTKRQLGVYRFTNS